MARIRSVFLTAVFLFCTGVFAEGGTHLGVWELRRLRLDSQSGASHPVHRILFSEKGIYSSTAAPKGGIEIKYKLERVPGKSQYCYLLLQDPVSNFYDRIGILCVDKRGMTLTYVHDGSVATYRRVSHTADPKLLINSGKIISVLRHD